MNAESRKFLGMMMVVISVAGLVWLVAAVMNYRAGEAFNWAGVALFLIILAALALARGRKADGPR